MARIVIEDLEEDEEISSEDMKKVLGGYSGTTFAQPKETFAFARPKETFTFARPKETF